jgi:SAM-dependent methyltransferase
VDAEAWDRRYDRDEYVWHAEPNQFLPGLVGGSPPGRALDLGCGEGRNAVWLAAQGWEVTAVDFSRVGVAKGERLADRHGVTVEWRVADVTAWTPSDTYDLVLIFYLQLPDRDRAAMLRTAAQALAPGATFVMVAHDRTNLTDGIGGPQDAAVLPTPELVVADLRAAAGPDLVVERAERITRTVDTEAGPRDAIDCLVRARRA